MLRFIVLAVVLAAACAFFIPEDANSLKNIDNGGDMADKCPNCLNIYHKFGKRVDGDRLLKEVVREEDEGGSLRIAFILYYLNPTETPSVLTFAEIHVKQSNNQSTASITHGGIGDYNMRIALKAENFTYFQFRTLFYGREV